MSAQFNLIKFHPATPNPPRWWLQSPRGTGGGYPRPLSGWWLILAEPKGGTGVQPIGGGLLAGLPHPFPTVRGEGGLS